MLMIPFLDLKRINEPHLEGIQRAMHRVAESGWFVLGSEVAQFETHFADYCQTRHCIGVANGLDALTLTLKAWELPPGSEVILASNAYVAGVLAVRQAGLTAVLVEPERHTYNLDPLCIEAAITPQTRVIMCVHLYGRCCNMEPINVLAAKYGLRVLTDAAQAHGAMYNGIRAGGLADAAGWSFYPTKNLGALGDAGAVTTNDDDLADRLRYWRNYGSGQKYHNQYVGQNSRLDELQAAILTEKLTRLDDENKRRRQLARRYLTELNPDKLTLPPADAIDQDAWHLFVVRHPDRTRFINYLQQRGIGTDVHYPIPPHRQQAFPEWHSLELPVSEQLHREVVSLPLNPTLTDDEAGYVIDVINGIPGYLSGQAG